MGMVMYLRRAAPMVFARIGDDPRAAEAFLLGDYAARDVNLGPNPDPDLVEFDKAWQALHFLLTGVPYGAGGPLDVIAGDAPQLGGEGSGQPDAWALAPARMAAFHAALSALDDEALAARYELRAHGLDAMLANDIYMADAFVGDDGAIDYIMQGVPALRRLAAGCAASGDGAIRLLA